MKRYLPLISCIFIAAAPRLASANREEGVASPFSGSQPFMIVHQDESDSSKREPGLYLRNGSDWRLLLAGSVLTDPNRGPVFQHLDLNTSDDRMLAMTVVNGQLILFNVFSTHDDPLTYLVFGKDKPFSEIATGTKRYLPEIQSAKDIAIFESNKTMLPDGRQLVLVSIKSDLPSSIAAADGVTFAIRVKKSEGPNILLDGPPLILDNHFHSTSELQGMVQVINNRFLVYSEILQNSFLGRLSVENYGEYQGLVKKLADRQCRYQESNPNFCPNNELAAWEANTGSAVYKDLIKLSQQLGEFVFDVEWPLFSGTPHFTISASGHSLRMNGRPRLKQTANGPVLWGASDRRRSPSGTIFALDNNLFFAYFINESVRIAKLEALPDSQLPENVHLRVQPEPNDSNKFHLIVTFSKPTPESRGPEGSPESQEGETKRYLLKADQGLDRLAILDTVQLSHSYYVEDEFEARLYAEKGVIGFDNITPPTPDRHVYEQTRDLSAPYSDLIKSINGLEEHIFTNPTAEHVLADGLVYREFSYRQVGKNPTGLYFSRSTRSDDHTFVEGTLIKPEGSKTFDLLSQGAPIQSALLGTLSARLYALDPSNRGGVNGYHLLLNLNGSKDNVNWNALSAGIPVRSPLANLNGTRVIAGRKDKSDQIFAVVLIEDQLYYAHYPMDAAKYTFGPSKFTGISGTKFASIDEVMQRLVYDSTGELYLVLSPGISPNSREFLVQKLSTGAKSFPKRETGANAVTFDFDTNMNDLFPTMNTESRMSWKVHPFREEVAQGAQKTSAIDLAKSQLFAEFRKHLSEAADPKTPAKRKILIVPTEIRDLAIKFVRESYLIKSQRDVTDGSNFHRYNRQLGLYIFDTAKADQDAIFENFEIIKSRPADQSVIVADIKDVIDVGQPTSQGSTPFVLNIPELANGGVSDDLLSDEGESRPAIEYRSVTPHAFYLLATGSPVPYEDFRKQAPDPVATTILVGTQEELKALEEAAEVEMAAGIDKAFEIIELPLPTLESKTEMLTSLMNRADVKGLDFKFDSSQISDTPATSQDEARRKIFEYAVTRTEAVSRPRGENPFSAFMEFQKLFAEKILTDPIVRQTRLIDKSFVERVVTLQFNLPLNLADLPSDDPRRILSSDDAVFRMQRAGMLGEFALKAEIIRLTLAQLNHDPTRAMPSTWIWAGEPGTGKSKAWQALVKMLNLKLYNRNDQAGKLNANGFYLDTSRVSKAKGIRAVEEVINDLNDFIASPKGSTGFIFIDDLQFADDDLGKAIVQWIRSLQQSEGGIYRFQKSDGTHASISVQNLTIGLAMNFSDNKEILKQFTGDDISSLIGKIVATGSRYGIDKSFVDRFGGVYNFDKFHESVKEPSLNEAILEAAQKKLARTGQFVMVDPGLVRMAAQAFPNLGARPFLSKSTDAIISLPDQVQLGRSKVFAVIPKTQEELKAEKSAEKPKGTGAWKEESGEVKSWVSAHSHVIELEQGLAAPLMLTRLMIPSFRSPILEAIVYSLQTDPKFKADRLSKDYFLGPLLFAAFDHLMRAETIPLKDLELEEAKFGIKSTTDREEFRKLIDDLSLDSSPFVVAFPNNGGRLSLWAEMGVNGKGANRVESRKDVLRTYADRIHTVLHRHLMRILYVQDMAQLEDTEHWLQSLPERIPFNSEKLGRDLNDLLFQFMKDFHSQDLVEASSTSGQGQMEPYVAARFFFMALDKAISRLPWAELGQKMVQALKLITQDGVLGQSVGVQNFLFNPEGRSSLLKPTTTNMLHEMIEFEKLVRETEESVRKVQRERFESSCEGYLAKRGS